MSKPIKSTAFTMTFVLVCVAVFSALVISGVYQLTLGPIKKAKNDSELEAIREVVYGDFANNPYEERHEIAVSHGKGKVDLFPARDENGKITSVAIKTYSKNGFGGRIEMMLGLMVDGTINKYKIIEHKETPGLGSKITESRFSDQFHGMNPGRKGFKVKQDGGDVDAITAATISSRAVVDAIRRGYNALNKLSKGNQHEQH